MILSLTDKDLTTLKENGSWSYRLNGDIKVSGFENKEDALKDASIKLKRMIRQIINKKP